MNALKISANRILDQHKEGKEFSQHDINRALRDAGDLAPMRSEGMAEAIPQEADGGGESRSIGLVAENLIRLSQKTWKTRR